MSQFCKHFYFLHDVLFGCVFRLVLDLQQNLKKRKINDFTTYIMYLFYLKDLLILLKATSLIYAFHYIEIIH